MIDTNNKFNRDQRGKREFPTEMSKAFLEDLEFDLDLGLDLGVRSRVRTQGRAFCVA